MAQDKLIDYIYKEKRENNFPYNTCYICFLYHFELDSKYEDGIHYDDFVKIKSEIENTIKKKELLEITYHEKWIVKTPVDLSDTYRENYTINKSYLNINLKLSDLNNLSLTSKEFEYYQINLERIHIDVFDKGPATVNFQFELTFKKGFDSSSSTTIYHVYKKIYSKIYESIEKEQIEYITDNEKNYSEELTILKQIYDIIKDIKKILIKDRSYIEGLKGTSTPFVLFCIPKIHDTDKLKQFFSLIYLKQYIDKDSLEHKIEKDKNLKKIVSSYSPDSNEHHFVNTARAGLLIYNDSQIIKFYCRVMEWYTYSWLFPWYF